MKILKIYNIIIASKHNFPCNERFLMSVQNKDTAEEIISFLNGVLYEDYSAFYQQEFVEI